VIVRIGISLD